MLANDVGQIDSIELASDSVRIAGRRLLPFDHVLVGAQALSNCSALAGTPNGNVSSSINRIECSGVSFVGIDAVDVLVVRADGTSAFRDRVAVRSISLVTLAALSGAVIVVMTIVWLLCCISSRRQWKNLR